METQGSTSTVPVKDNDVHIYIYIHIYTLFCLNDREKRVERIAETWTGITNSYPRALEFDQKSKHRSVHGDLTEPCVNMLSPFSIWRGDGHGPCQEKGGKRKDYSNSQNFLPSFTSQEKKEMEVDF